MQEALMYQPDEVDAGRCRALMWNGGRGRLQCSRKPLRGRELCGRCEAESTPYGKVRGAIPARVMKLFREKALKPARESKQWYARHLMWAHASAMVPELENLNDVDEDGRYKLTDEQYARCLQKIQEYVAKHKGSEGWKYERGAGVRGRDDRVGGGRFGTERERYNGRNGGRVFKWYTRPVFNNYLAQMGVSEESCTERQCMLALGATSDELRKYGMVTRRLTPYLGPQCYPHLDSRSVEYRVRANERAKTGVEDEETTDGRRPDVAAVPETSAVLDERCWMQCDRRGCGKWRCVAAASVGALRGDGFSRCGRRTWTGSCGCPRRRRGRRRRRLRVCSVLSLERLSRKVLS